jgi:hypothetical protein
MDLVFRGAWLADGTGEAMSAATSASPAAG